WTLGFNNNFTYKNFDVNIYTIARWGQMMEYDFTASYDPQGKGNHPAYLDYWTAENPTNDFPRPDLTNFYNYLGYQSYSYVDGSYIKLKTVTIGYRLPKSFTDRAHLNGARLYLSGNNLFSWSKSDLVQNYDAERGGSAKSPLLRQFVFGINLDFKGGIIMRKIYKYIIGIGLVSTLAGCTLEENNPGGTTAEVVFSTENGINALVNSAYVYFGSQFYGREDILMLTEGGTDLWIHIANTGYGRQMTKYDGLVATTGQIRNTWNRFYEIVNYCNAGLERIGDVSFTNEEEKKARIGELSFLRAYAYWHLVEQYG